VNIELLRAIKRTTTYPAFSKNVLVFYKALAYKMSCSVIAQPCFAIQLGLIV